ncbi:MAG: hypothetical protein IT384_16780 [Deltaproteobacteria bacterium]|nr:hypothetical protein [Deltaproteobacteria bacterium]
MARLLPAVVNVRAPPPRRPADDRIFLPLQDDRRLALPCDAPTPARAPAPTVMPGLEHAAPESGGLVPAGAGSPDLKRFELTRHQKRYLSQLAATAEERKVQADDPRTLQLWRRLVVGNSKLSPAVKVFLTRVLDLELDEGPRDTLRALRALDPAEVRACAEVRTASGEAARPVISISLRDGRVVLLETDRAVDAATVSRFSPNHRGGFDARCDGHLRRSRNLRLGIGDRLDRLEARLHDKAPSDARWLERCRARITNIALAGERLAAGMAGRGFESGAAVLNEEAREARSMLGRLDRVARALGSTVTLTEHQAQYLFELRRAAAAGPGPDAPIGAPAPRQPTDPDHEYVVRSQRLRLAAEVGLDKILKRQGLDHAEQLEELGRGDAEWLRSTRRNLSISVKILERRAEQLRRDGLGEDTIGAYSPATMLERETSQAQATLRVLGRLAGATGIR